MKLILKEILHRKFNFLMGLLGMVTIVALVVFFYTMTRATQKETIRLTRDMGFNVRIIPGETDINQFWVDGYSNLSMSQEVVDKLVDQKSINYAHLTATLHKRIQWRDKHIVLTGIADLDVATSFMRRGISNYLVKPVDGKKLTASVANAIAQRQFSWV